MVEGDANEVLNLWQPSVETLKKHIHYKRRQFKEVYRITVSLTTEEILIHLDYSENYKSKHQNKIHICGALRDLVPFVQF